jgi:hypothetical protein
METQTIQSDVDDILARLLPPLGFEEHLVVLTRGYYVWMRAEQVLPDESICLYDGDCRDVLLPTDPRLKHRFQ